MSRIALLLLVIVFVLSIPFVLVRYLWATFTSPRRALSMALAHDRLLNTTTNGSDRESISSRAAFAREEGKRWGCVLCKWLDQIDPNHCDKSKGI